MSTELKTKLGEAVAKKRDGRSIREIADTFQVPHASIQRVEEGQMPKARLFVELVTWLGVISPKTAKKLLKYTD